VTRMRILFADNDADFLQTWREFLEREGYQVIPALDPTEARAILERKHIDLAVIDIRLVNDDDEKDVSGLELANRLAPTVPKIILTRFATYDAVREALGPQIADLPAAVDFLRKQDGPQALLTAVRKAAKREGRYFQTINGLSDKIESDYEEARQQAKVNYWASLGVSIAGIIIIFASIGLVIGMTATEGGIEMGILTAVSGVVAEAVGLLFFKRADTANGRMDRYHDELLETRRFDNLLAACDELLTDELKENCKEGIIGAATGLWFGRVNVPEVVGGRSNRE